jgi:hypothetical protein
MAFAIAGAVLGGASLVSGIFSSNKAAKAQKQAIALQRDTLDFNKQKYAENQALYGGINQQMVDDAKKGVTADLQGVSDRASNDVAVQYQNAQDANLRAEQRMGINPNSGRADSTMQKTALAQALAASGNITKARENERVNADNQTYARRSAVYQSGNQQLNNDSNAVNNASQNLASGYQNQSNQENANAGQAFGAAVGLGLKAYDAYKATPVSGTMPTGTLGSGVMANQPAYQAPSAFSATQPVISASPVGQLSIPQATNSFLTAPTKQSSGLSLVPR